MIKIDKNIGAKDKKARISAGVVLLIASIFISGVIGNVMSIIGVILLVTAFLNYCPAYTLTGQNTCEADGAATSHDDSNDKAA